MVLVNQKPGFETVSTGLSSNSSIWRLISATVVKELKIWTRYKVNFLTGFLEVALIAGVFFIFASAASFRGLALTQDQRFLFFYVAIMVNLFSTAALWAPLNSVNNDLYNGTLEFVYSTPSSKYAYFVGTALADAIRKFAYAIPMLIGLAFIAKMSWTDILYGIGVMLVAIVAFVSMGVIISSLAVMYKQVGAIAGILNLFFDFFAGAYIPLMIYPKAIQYAAFIFPHAYAYDLVRYYSIGPEWQTIFPVWIEWIGLVVNIFFYLFLTIFILKKVEKHSKKSGLHLI